MKFQPFGSLVLVEKLEESKENTSGIYLPDSHVGRFWKVKIITLGLGVDLAGLFKDDICMANPIPEIDNEKAFENPNYMLIHSKNILGRWEE